MMLVGLMTMAMMAPTLDCATTKAAIAAEGVCVEDGFGVVVADDDQTARGLLEKGAAGARRFRLLFGREPARYVLTTYDTPQAGVADRQRLRELGFEAVLAQPSAALVERQRSGMTTSVASGPDAVGGPAQIQRRNDGGSGEPRGANHVAHELGHLWYSAAFFPAPSNPGALRYGSAAPDWMDEAAAMLLEDDAGAEAYRQRFANGRSADPQKSAGIPPEMPLAELTTMVHPALASAPNPASANGPVQILRSPPSLFYAETRVFMDYLIDRSGDPQILSILSDGLGAGSSLNDWLAKHGSDRGLPVSMPDMQSDWDRWLDKRYGSTPT